MNKYPASSNQLTELPPSVIPRLDRGIQSYSGSANPDTNSKLGRVPTNPARLSPFAWPFLAFICIYRYTVGHWFAGNCRFYPSCSHYGEEAFRRHGAWCGSIMTIKRLSRCHPWHEGGYDPVE